MTERTLVTLTITVDVDAEAARSLEVVFAGSGTEPPVDGITAGAEQVGWLASRLVRDSLDRHALDPGSPEVAAVLTRIPLDGEF